MKKNWDDGAEEESVDIFIIINHRSLHRIHKTIISASALFPLVGGGGMVDFCKR